MEVIMTDVNGNTKMLIEGVDYVLEKRADGASFVNLIPSGHKCKWNPTHSLKECPEELHKLTLR